MPVDYNNLLSLLQPQGQTPQLGARLPQLWLAAQQMQAQQAEQQRRQQQEDEDRRRAYEQDRLNAEVQKANLKAIQAKIKATETAEQARAQFARSLIGAPSFGEPQPVSSAPQASQPMAMPVGFQPGTQEFKMQQAQQPAMPAPAQPAMPPAGTPEATGAVPEWLRQYAAVDPDEGAKLLLSYQEKQRERAKTAMETEALAQVWTSFGEPPARAQQLAVLGIKPTAEMVGQDKEPQAMSMAETLDALAAVDDGQPLPAELSGRKPNESVVNLWGEKRKEGLSAADVKVVLAAVQTTVSPQGETVFTFDKNKLLEVKGDLRKAMDAAVDYLALEERLVSAKLEPEAKRATIRAAELRAARDEWNMQPSANLGDPIPQTDPVTGEPLLDAEGKPVMTYPTPDYVDLKTRQQAAQSVLEDRAFNRTTALNSQAIQFANLQGRTVSPDGTPPPLLAPPPGVPNIGMPPGGLVPPKEPPKPEKWSSAKLEPRDKARYDAVTERVKGLPQNVRAEAEAALRTMEAGPTDEARRSLDFAIAWDTATKKDRDAQKKRDSGADRTLSDPVSKGPITTERRKVLARYKRMNRAAEYGLKGGGSAAAEPASKLPDQYTSPTKANQHIAGQKILQALIAREQRPGNVQQAVSAAYHAAIAAGLDKTLTQAQLNALGREYFQATR